MPNTKFKQRLGYNKGRTPGSPNVLTRSIREGLLAVWHQVNGVDGMVQWVERDDSNRGQFYGFLTKLLPTELAESGLTGNITVIVQRSPSPTESVDLKSLPLVINSSACLPQEDEGGPDRQDGGTT
jgi:hypothetical protein